MPTLKVAEGQSLSAELVEELRQLFLGTQFEPFRRALTGDPPAQEELSRVTREVGVHNVRT